MRQAGVGDYEAFARYALRAIPDRPMSFEVFSDDFDDMERQARRIASWGENVYVKIPITNTEAQPSKTLVYRLTHSGVKVNVTAVLSLRQVQEAADALNGGAPSAISVFAGRIADTGRDPIPLSRAIDTIEIAKRKIPGARYSLDELCKRFGVDLTARSKHGALLDADLTAQIYLELVGGRQRGLALAPAEIVEAKITLVETVRARPVRLAPLLTAEELALHAAFIAKELGENSVWSRISG